MKVYTKTGDHGTTSLIGGERVSKCDPRVEAYGSVDELAAFVALLSDHLRPHAWAAQTVYDLSRILSRLMSVEALLAVGESGREMVAAFDPAEISWLETQIDSLQSQLPALTKFTIPGGSSELSLCHVCRTICRRAERESLRADAQHPIDPSVLVYLNRLSDYFYLLGRSVGQKMGIEEQLWIP